ncbi:IniB N-terminal domain-containing protein [Pseudonocardia spinosispora]|uniref:IniB N-terminal domain-containing protein n=1 Tax=Pseudonocardia spinosispora TaxID=103441 RepID=UPI0004110040|nr:IniB N-terminal domain-containing protein [Pseudonocardia spinosispora]
MTASTSLLDWILSLLRDPDARADFQADPSGYAADHGFDGLTSADVHDALCLIADNGSASYDHKSFNDHNHVHYPPPPPHEHSHHDAPHYLNHYITNNYTTVEDHSTDIDNSVHQNIDTHGGDFDQVIDNDPVVASGDGAVASGGDIDGSTVTTGDHNVVGDDNHAVTGDDNTTSFGSGDANNTDVSHSSFGDGSALAAGGDAAGHSTDTDTTTAVHNSGSGETSVNAAGDHGYADTYADQSEHDDSAKSNYEDHSSSDSHDQVASHNDSSYSDSNDYDTHHA